MDEKDIYIDLLLNNSIQSENNALVKAHFFSSQSKQIIPRCKNHKISIIRFTLDTGTLPIFECIFKNNSPIYNFTMTYNNFTYTQNFIWISQNQITNDNYAYTYSYVVYLLNLTLKNCMDGLNSLASTTFNSPYFDFNATTQLLELNTTNELGMNEQNKLSLYMNESMYSLLNGFTVSYISNDKILLNPCGDKYIIYQNYSSVNRWNPVQSLVFTTNLIPIYSSVTPQIQIYKDGQISNNTSNYNFMNIITDFIANDEKFQPFIQYSAQIYRFIALKDGSSIQNLDISIFWLKKSDGSINQLYLSCNSNASVKLLITDDNN